MSAAPTPVKESTTAKCTPTDQPRTHPAIQHKKKSLRFFELRVVCQISTARVELTLEPLAKYTSHPNPEDIATTAVIDALSNSASQPTNEATTNETRDFTEIIRVR